MTEEKMRIQITGVKSGVPARNEGREGIDAKINPLLEDLRPSSGIVGRRGGIGGHTDS